MTRLRLAAVLSGAAAVMHVAASAGHVHESLVLAPIFAVAAVLQLAWAARVWRTPATRVLLAGVVLSLGLAAVWALSRSTGLPGLGREAVGPLDLQCTLDELLASALVVSTLVRWRTLVAYAVEAAALAAVAASFVVLASGVGHA